jgi:lipid II:glycine glycyltransferase (peptidoglycan interpeptide bridge formation enzyme)
MPTVTLSEWNDFLSRNPQAHLLQSGEWGELKTAFGWDAVRLVRGALGAQVLFRRLPLGLTFAYIPKGPVRGEASSADDPAFWDEIDALCREHRAIFLKVEEDGWLDPAQGEPPLPPPGFRFSPQHVQPRSTLVIDLQGSEDEVFERMKPKTRYNVRLAGRKEVVVHASTDIERFYNIMEVTSRREAFHVHSLNYYRRAYELFAPQGMCALFLADYQERTLAGVMVFANRRSGYYFYGASGDQERNRKPTYPLQWEAIRWALARGCQEYDMWGIPDEVSAVTEDEESEREDGLWGVYRFKRGFGGSIRRTPRTLERVYNPLFYRLYLWRLGGSGSD